jgi:hypothetical protein
MPRLRRQSDRSRYVPGIGFALRSGVPIVGCPDWHDDGGLDTLQAAWDSMRSDLMEQTERETGHGWPRRPWGWWIFEQDVEALSRFGIAAPWEQARELHRLEELDVAEKSRLPGLIRERLGELKRGAPSRGSDEAERLREFAGELGVDMNHENR